MKITEWFRYRRFYRALVIDAYRNKQPLDHPARAALKAQARTATKVVGRL